MIKEDIEWRLREYNDEVQVIFDIDGEFYDITTIANKKIKDNLRKVSDIDFEYSIIVKLKKLTNDRKGEK